MPRGSSRAWFSNCFQRGASASLGISGRSVSHKGLQQPHGVRSLSVPDGLDVRVRRRVNRRRDRDAVGQVQILRDVQPSRHPRSTRSWSGSTPPAVGDIRANLPLSRILNSRCFRFPGARGRGRMRGGGRSAPVLAQPAAGADGTHLPQSVGPLLESLDRRHRNHLCACRFREAEVVFQQRVLGAVSGSPSCSNRIPGSRCAPDPRRRNMDRARSCLAYAWVPSGPKNTPTGVGTKVSPQPISSATSLTMRSPRR